MLARTLSALAILFSFHIAPVSADEMAYASPDTMDATPIFGRADIVNAAVLSNVAYECRMRADGGVVCLFDRSGAYKICFGTGECFETDDPMTALALYRPEDYGQRAAVR